MEIHIINLLRSTDRKKRFNEYNLKYIDKYNFFEAIDGNKINISEISDELYSKRAINYTSGTIGSALSHLKLWEKSIGLNKPILIMEDDAIVSHDFNNHLNNVMKMLPENWDILQLSYNFDSVLNYDNTVYEQSYCMFGRKNMTKTDVENFVNSKIYPTIARLNNSFGISAYVVSPKGAKILKRKCFPLDNRLVNIRLPFIKSKCIRSYTVDCIMNTVYKDINAYVCPIPFVITPHISDELNTTTR